MPNWKEDVVLTTEEATQYLKISKPTLLKQVRRRKIKAIKVGRGWRFLQSELYRFLKGMERDKKRVSGDSVAELVEGEPAVWASRQ